MTFHYKSTPNFCQGLNLMIHEYEISLAPVYSLSTLLFSYVEIRSSEDPRLEVWVKPKCFHECNNVEYGNNIQMKED